MTTNPLTTASTPLPPSARFSPGIIYSGWKQHVQLYIKHFPASQLAIFVMVLISRNAFDIIADNKLLKKEDNLGNFTALRLLYRSGLPSKLRGAFLARYHGPGEIIEAYVRDLHRMAEADFANESQDHQDKRVLEQQLGIQTHVRREFRLHPPERLDTALQVAEQLEQVDAAMGTLNY